MTAKLAELWIKLQVLGGNRQYLLFDEASMTRLATLLFRHPKKRVIRGKLEK